MLSFKPTFSLSSFTFIKRLFSSSSLSAIRLVSICISEVIDVYPSNLDSSSLRPHGLQHARPPCPSPTPKLTQTRVHQVGDAIQPSHPLSSPLMSLLFNMLSRLVITFLPRSKHLLISWQQSPCAVILEPRKIVSHCFHCFPIYFP